jgi:hypothetical protein
MRGTWIIDDRGQVWSETDPAFKRMLCTERSGAALTNFLLSQMGFVAVREHDKRTEILFDPACVSSIALTEYFYWSADRVFRATSCVDVGNAAVSAAFFKPLDLYNHLGRVIEMRTPRPDFTQDMIDLNRSSFRERWRAAVEVCATDIAPMLKLNIIEDMFSGHVVLAERGSDGDYVFANACHRFHGYDSSLWSTLQGRSFRQAEDKLFGDWTANYYRGIDGRDAPIAESVSALIAFQSRGRQRYYYDRLIIPMVTRSGADALLIAVNHK